MNNENFRDETSEQYTVRLFNNRDKIQQPLSVEEYAIVHDAYTEAGNVDDFFYYLRRREFSEFKLGFALYLRNYLEKEDKYD